MFLFFARSSNHDECPWSMLRLLLLIQRLMKYWLGLRQQLINPKADKVLIKIEAVTLNPIDWKIQNSILRPTSSPQYQEAAWSFCLQVLCSAFYHLAFLHGKLLWF
ncbi:uncharacterized protein LOC110702795 isoform X2 [Chenopodium quinoa]|uniref:uncharacterized protein LOC110702795 isoform X2 n=1 Tax=Chenopodium quinoa TaxID=63459 RepID=UPI000B78C0BA|nr:uncharacterized protein LOC110702795 isoform X2 [Chenopodium quinoa]